MVRSSGILLFGVSLSLLTGVSLQGGTSPGGQGASADRLPSPETHATIDNPTFEIRVSGSEIDTTITGIAFWQEIAFGPDDTQFSIVFTDVLDADTGEGQFLLMRPHPGPGEYAVQGDASDATTSTFGFYFARTLSFGERIDILADRGTLQITRGTDEAITGSFSLQGSYSQTALEGMTVPEQTVSFSGTFEAHRNDEIEP